MRLETVAEVGEVEWEKVGEEGEIVMGEGEIVVMGGSGRWEKGGVGGLIRIMEKMGNGT